MLTCCEGGHGSHLGDFVGRRISSTRYVVQYKRWDCRMAHACSTEGKKVVRFDTTLITIWLVFEGVQKLEIMVW